MDERHRRLLIKQNPWWKDKHIALPEFERYLLEELLRYIKYKQILAVIGLRRVGKTILLKQIIQKLNSTKNNICYISFDDIDFQKYTIAEDIINYFLEFSDKNTTRYLFLDEIQKLPHWADLLKTYYTRRTYEIGMKIKYKDVEGEIITIGDLSMTLKTLNGTLVVTIKEIVENQVEIQG